MVAVDTAKIKTPAGIVIIVCLVLAIIGAICVGDEKATAWLSAVAVFCPALLLLYVLLGQLAFAVIATGIVMTLSGAFVAGADAANKRNDSSDEAGYSLMIIGMWVAFLAIAVTFGLELAKGLIKNIPAVIIVAFNFLGCILLWAADTPAITLASLDGASSISNGILAMLNSIIFIVAVVDKSGTAVWINIFASVCYQLTFLAGAIASDAVAVNKDNTLTTGYIFVWISSLLYVAYHMFFMSGGNLQATLGNIKALVSIRGIILLLCIVGCIIGAAITTGSANGTRWLFANQIFTVIFLCFALIDSGERKTAWAMCSCALVVSTTPFLVWYTKIQNDQGTAYGGILATDHWKKDTAGAALICACEWLAWLAYGLNDSIKQAPASIKAGGPLGIVRILAFVLVAIGLICWWRYEDSFIIVAPTLQQSISTLMAVCFIIGAYYMQTSEFVKSTSMFFATAVCIMQLAVALSVNTALEYGETGKAGMVLCWLAFIIFITLYCIEGVTGGAAGEGQQREGNPAAAHGGHSKQISPQPKVHHEPAAAGAHHHGDNQSPAATEADTTQHVVTVHTEKV